MEKIQKGLLIAVWVAVLAVQKRNGGWARAPNEEETASMSFLCENQRNACALARISGSSPSSTASLHLFSF
jgi:hypothetical protein